MKQSNRIQKILSIIFSLALILLLAVPSQVLAQEETPQPEPTVEAPVEEPAADVPADVEPAVEEPAVEVPVAEAPVTESPAAEEPAIEQPAVDEPATEAAIAEIVDVLAAEEAVLVDESGEEIPFASQEAAEVLAGGDPWFLANDGSGDVIGYTSLLGSCAPLVTICNQVAYPVQAAIDDERSDGQDITIAGYYSEQIIIVGKDVNLIGATTGGGLYAPGELGYNFTMGSTGIFSLIYIENSTVNIQGLTINGSGGYVDSSGSDIYAGVTFNNATGSVVASTINGFMDSSENDQGVGVLVYNIPMFSKVSIEQNEITNAETGILVKNSESTTISNNKIHDFSIDSEEGDELVGIDLQNATDTYIADNKIYDIHSLAWFMKAYGIKVENSEETWIRNNLIHDVRDPSCNSLGCGLVEWLTGYGYDGFGVYINDSVDTNLFYNDILDNDKGVTINESWHPHGEDGDTDDVYLEANDIFQNSQYNLKNDINEDIDAVNNYWGVNAWPNPGGWNGVWHCHPKWYNCHSHDGFKQLAKLEGVTEDEIKWPAFTENEWDSPLLDVDEDSIYIFDNCPWDSNTDQADFDNDGRGDICDPDDDGDGVDDEKDADNCLLEFNPEQTDSDGDGIGNECDPTPFPPSPEGEDALVVPFTGLIPVTGGQLIQLPCDSECVTLQLPDGSWAEFCGLCDYWASLTEETGETMPYDLPEGKTMLNGLTVVLMDPAQVLLNSLPAGTTLQVGFPKGGEAASDLLIDFYDTSASNWLELPALESGDDLQANMQMPGTAIVCK